MDNNRTYYSRQAETRASRKNTALMALALGVGVGVGAAAGLMFAPISGQKMREGLGHSIEEGINRGHEIVDPIVKRLEKEVAELRQNIEDQLKDQRKA